VKILLLAEGDAERWDSWSGSTKSLVDHLRAAGHTVSTRDVDLYGSERWLAALPNFSSNRKRWGVKYHLSEPGYRWRSRKAARAVAAHQGPLDCIVQVGATFVPPSSPGVPYALFCDSNIQMSVEGAAHGVSDAAWLRPAELDALRRRETRLYRDAAAVFTISEYLRRSFVDEFGVPADRVCTVGAGPNLDLRRVPTPRTAPRTGPPTVLFVGRQFERKGGPLMLEAFRSVRASLPDARLVIVGPESRPATEPGVQWMGSLDKNRPEEWARMVAAYQDADVFCLPSLFEPFGIVVLEAMFFGLPCVGTAAWAIPEMIADGETGFTVPRADATALGHRLRELLVDRSRAHRMGLAGRRRAEERFSWAGVAARMADVLERCIVHPSRI
jgi:glycosyltransferase involved in cell wall biosynthesis